MPASQCCLLAKIVILGMGDEAKATLKPFLDGELERQKHLKNELAQDPVAAGWIEEKHLFQNYKQLQFFDALALYFNCVHEDAREATEFPHIPLTADEDVTIALRPTAKGVYGLSPYPFGEDPLKVSFVGRWLVPLAGGDDDLKQALDAAAPDQQLATLVSA